MSATENITERAFGYIPSPGLAIAAATVYGLVGSALSFRVMKSKAWWALCLPIGSSFESLGFTLRFLSKYKPDSVILFAIEQLLIVCAPAAFLAFNYIVYGRLISHIGAEHSVVNPQKIAKIFVISDVSTFLMQAGGSGLASSDKLQNVGEKVILVGLILQFVSYGFFCALLVKSHISIKAGGASQAYDSCKVLIWALYISSALISIRSIYRIIEFAQGKDSYLLTHEVFLYALDALPLVLAIAVYIPWWPTKYLKHDKSEGLEMGMTYRP